MSRAGDLEYIDALRGLAIFGVLCVHFAKFGMGALSLEGMPFNFDNFLTEGRYGVALFFVVSAFTLSRSIESRIMTEPLAIRKYFLRRFFRIAPSFYLVILLVFFIKGTGSIYYVNPAHPELTWFDLLTHITFTNGFFPYYVNDFLGVEWSIATEFCFYMLLPFFMFFLLLQLQVRVKFFAIIGLFIMALYMYWLISVDDLLFTMYENLDSSAGNAWSYFFIGSQLHVFIVGILVWQFMQLDLHKYISNKTAITCLFICLFIAILFTYMHGEHVTNELFSFLALPFWAMMSGLLIVFLDIVRPKLAWLEFLGKISFSLYLVHLFIGSKTAEPTGIWLNIAQISTSEIAFGAYFLLNTVLSICVAFLMHKFIELPGMRLGKYFINRRYS